MSIRDDGRHPWFGKGRSQPHATGQHWSNGSTGGAGQGQHACGASRDAYRHHPPQREAATSDALSADSERNWAIAAHLTGFISAYAALGFLGPLICLRLVGDRSPFARHHAVEALNFNVTWLAYILACWVLTQILVGWVLLAGLGIAYFVLVVRAALATSRGDDYEYPLTVRLIH